MPLPPLKKRHPDERTEDDRDLVPFGDRDGRVGETRRKRPTVREDPNEADRDAPDAPPPGSPGDGEG